MSEPNMSEPERPPELDTAAGELDEPSFDEEALRARRRQYGLIALSIVVVVVAVLAIPWRDHVTAGGRIAPHRWARVFAEAPGVVREVPRIPGDSVEEGEVIAVLDYDEQRDALEVARLGLDRERQKLADLELRLRENTIQREGADALAKLAGERAVAAGRIDGTRLAALDPVADSALEGVRNFTAQVRAELAQGRSGVADGHFEGDDLYRQVSDAMARYSANAAAVADQLVKVAGAESGRQFRFELEDLRFAYERADHSMQELLTKRQLVEQGFLAPVSLRDPCVQLEREVMELAHGFRNLAGNARLLLGSPAEQGERVRRADESRQLLASESERLKAEGSSVESGIAAAELAVRSAERHQGKRAIRAPIRGTLAGESLSRFDAVGANAPVAVVEDSSRLVLKVLVEPAVIRRIKVGQAVESRVPDGRTIRGSVVWRTPVMGQTVRNQAWNVLIQLEGNNDGFGVGDKVMASIDVGRRNLIGRWLEPAGESVPLPRIAFVEDPTELRTPLGSGEYDKLAFERPHSGSEAKGR